jgi:hypothetical protein
MGLYNNEMPESGVDGFSLKIKQSITQAKIKPDNLDEIFSSEQPKLVEICKPIPINDKKMEEVISRGKRRLLNKPKEVEVANIE